jgi:hypothetical protein
MSSNTFTGQMCVCAVGATAAYLAAWILLEVSPGPTGCMFSTGQGAFSVLAACKHKANTLTRLDPIGRTLPTKRIPATALHGDRGTGAPQPSVPSGKPSQRIGGNDGGLCSRVGSHAGLRWRHTTALEPGQGWDRSHSCAGERGQRVRSILAVRKPIHALLPSCLNSICPITAAVRPWEGARQRLTGTTIKPRSPPHLSISTRAAADYQQARCFTHSAES